MQLFARDETNYGHFDVLAQSAVSGTFSSHLYEVISGEVVESFTMQIKAGETFTFHHRIKACLKEYNYQAFLKDSSEANYEVLLVKNLVAGDFFIVDGQSNAECPFAGDIKHHDSTYYCPFNRAIGGNYTWVTKLSDDSSHTNYSIDNDCAFGRPSSLPFITNEKAYSGVWPIKLQYELAQQSGIPNCVVNGSEGGSSISHHFASHTPSIPALLKYNGGPKNHPPALLYDRIYKKLYENDAVKGVKGIFWYQGEMDGSYPFDSAVGYGNRFKSLYQSWKSDYPALKQIFVLQINTGCSENTNALIRETQRKLPEEYADVTVMSTVGAPKSDRNQDNCHYSIQGYDHIASKLVPLTSAYLYNFPLNKGMSLPANIQKAYYTSDNQVCLEFDKNILIQQSCDYALPLSGRVFLKDYFYKENKTELKLSSLHAEGNKLFLDLLEKQTGITTISYLPESFTQLSTIYAGPWILNEDNPDLGAYAFFEFPIWSPDQDFQCYPNPASDFLNLSFKENETHVISLYDLFGNRILSAETSDANIRIETEKMVSGFYLLEIKGPSVIKQLKILIEK